MNTRHHRAGESADLHARAKDFVAGPPRPFDETKALARELKAIRAFGSARRVIAKALKASDPDVTATERVWLVQQQALCTYKDPDLPDDSRLDRAVEILERLEGDESLLTTRDQETLGIAGAIYKRMWEKNGHPRHLERSLAYYLRGCTKGAAIAPDRIANDRGYTAINAAFVLDLLAAAEESEASAAGGRSETAIARRARAAELRRAIVAALGGGPPETADDGTRWWHHVTTAEALFGLQEYDEAWSLLEQARALPRDVWEYETTARQLAALACVQGDTPGAAPLAAKEALSAFLDGNEDAVESAFRGKLGLALSGGGFRASLYHIGVLARLAELDVLRHVEVLSCVSGGSIVGAHYYLEVRRLLQTKRDDEITPDDYVEIVARMQRQFLEGVQRNIRMRVVGSFVSNLRMIGRLNYSRTERVGDLYERELYSQVPPSYVKEGTDAQGRRCFVSDPDGGPKLVDRDEPIYLDDLLVRPLGAATDFAPKNDNWRRKNKVPILVLNATSLNTGHNWQFTATWMGEPPASIDVETDGNERLRRMYYSEAPEPYKRMRLGRAVGASSCVPGVFEPLAFDGLYPDRTVRLVDGGVHDNQGSASLLEQGCTVVLVSDASGQMTTDPNPSGGELGVLLRSNSVLQARVREAEASDVYARRRALLLRGLMFVHLKKELGVPPVVWVGADTAGDEETDDRLRAAWASKGTSYGVAKAVQERLAAIRTDLDSFTTVEAYALMASGYQMTRTYFPPDVRGATPDAPSSGAARWEFLKLERLLADPPDATASPFMRLLDVAKSLAFKIWILYPWLAAIPAALAIVALGLLAPIVWTHWSTPLVTVGWLVTAAAGMAAALVLGKLGAKSLWKVVRYRETLYKAAVGVVLATLGTAITAIHLAVFDRWYLKIGRLDRLSLDDEPR